MGRDIRRHPLWGLTQMRLREIAREPGTLFWIFGFPVLLTIALGLAFRHTAEPPIPVGLLAPAPEAWDRALTDAGFRVQRLAEAEAARQLGAGKIALLILPPETSPAAPADAPAAPVSYRFDPTRPEARLARLAVDQALQRAWGRRDAAMVRDDVVTQPGARYIDFLVPGLIGMNVMSGSMWAVAFAIANLRVRKLLKRLLATPMRRPHLLFSLVLARLVVLPFEVGCLLVFAGLAFDVRVQGALLAVAAIAALGSVCFGGIAILVASRGQNVETVMGLMNAVMLPMFLLSGVFFSPVHFPEAVQPLIAILPLSCLNQALRAVIIDGAGLPGVAVPCAILGVWGAAGYALGLRLFRWN